MEKVDPMAAEFLAQKNKKTRERRALIRLQAKSCKKESDTSAGSSGLEEMSASAMTRSKRAVFLECQTFQSNFTRVFHQRVFARDRCPCPQSPRALHSQVRPVFRVRDSRMDKAFF